MQPNIGDVLREVPSGSPVQRPEATLPGIRVPAQPPLRSLPQGGPTVEVKSITFVGNREISSEDLLSSVVEKADKRYTLADLELLASQLTRYYRTRGYFVARVYVPAQEIANGVLTLRVVEGTIGRFVLDNKSLLKDEVVQGILDHVKAYDIVSLDTLERAMLIVNDTPGARVVRADVKPGDAVGTSDFIVGTDSVPERQGYVLADNYGSLYTGRERLSFGLDLNSPSGSGDRVSLSGLGATNGRMLNGRAAYSSLVSYSGWRAELAATQTTYSLGDSYKALDALGTATGYELNLTYPIRRIQAQTVEFGLNYSHRDLKDEVRSTGTDTRKTSQSQSVSLSIRDERSALGLDGTTQGLIRITNGQLSINDAVARDLDQASGGARTEGSFTKAYASLSRSAALPMDFTLVGNFRSQFSLNGKNLDGSERLGISGVNGVSGYPLGEASGTDATLIGLELSQPLPNLFDVAHQWRIFANWGRSKTLKESAARELKDLGLGWSARGKDGLLLKAQVARRTGDPAVSEPDRTIRALLQAGWIF